VINKSKSKSKEILLCFSMLVGEGALIWARENKIEEVTTDYLKTGL
jgi:hypothetical protein